MGKERSATRKFGNCPNKALIVSWFVLVFFQFQEFAQDMPDEMTKGKERFLAAPEFSQGTETLTFTEKHIHCLT